MGITLNNAVHWVRMLDILTSRVQFFLSRTVTCCCRAPWRTKQLSTTSLETITLNIYQTYVSYYWPTHTSRNITPDWLSDELYNVWITSLPFEVEGRKKIIINFVFKGKNTRNNYVLSTANILKQYLLSFCNLLAWRRKHCISAYPTSRLRVLCISRCSFYGDREEFSIGVGAVVSSTTTFQLSNSTICWRTQLEKFHLIKGKQGILSF